MNDTEIESLFAHVVPSYRFNRAQAIEDGVLVDLNKVAEGVKLGKLPIHFPIACTAAVWDWINPTERELTLGQDLAGRLWDTVWMLSRAARQGGTTVLFTVIFLRAPQRGKYRHRNVQIKAVCGPGDNAEPVITLMLPSES